MSASSRAFSTLLYRLSTGVPLKSPNSYSFQGAVRLSKNLSCSSFYSSCAKWADPFEFSYGNSVRKIWTRGPLCMGRRSCKIAGRKGANDAKKAKLYSKVGKEVVSANVGVPEATPPPKELFDEDFESGSEEAVYEEGEYESDGVQIIEDCGDEDVKKGGPNPVSNTALAAILEKAKELDVPKDILERNIKRASDKGQEAYIEKVYEVYGYGGVGIIVEVSTDKINRSVARVREVVKDCGGKMADPGSIMFKFKRARVVNVKVTDADKDQLLNIALDALGADDVMYYKIVSSSDNYAEILSKLREEGIAFEPDNGSELLPLTSIEADDEAKELNKELMADLLDLDDVDAVYTDQK
ncbi:probable transcriptional regulatory protein [Tanacetum coccineum]